MKKLKLLLASLGMLLIAQSAHAQVGSNWTPVPWSVPNRSIHFELQSNTNADDNGPWFSEPGIAYAFDLTNPPIGTYERTAASEFTEIFRQYGPRAQSARRTEIRIEDNYNSGEIRQFEAYVTVNENLSSEQSLFQIWGWGPSATMLQLRINGTGRIIGVGGANPAEKFTDTDYRNREFKLNVIHRQETRTGDTVTSPGHCSVYIDGRLLLDFSESQITVHENLIKGANYFKYGVYGAIDNVAKFNNSLPGQVNAQGIYKDARYWRDGDFPGTTAQTINFPDLPAIALNAGDITPGAVSVLASNGAATGLTVSYRSDNPAVATIVNGKIRPASVGTAKIWAYQDGDSTHAPARVVVKTVTISPAVIVQQPQSIQNFGPIPAKLTTDAPFALNATATSGLPVSYESNNTAVATISGNIVTIAGAGSANITAKQAGNASFLAATPVTQTLTVTQARQTQSINFPPIGQKLITDPNFNPGATATSGLAVTYTSSNTAVAIVVGNQIDIIAAGTVTITANQAGNANFFPAPSVSQTFTVKTSVTYHKIKLRANPALVLTLVGAPANRAVVNVSTDTGSNNQLWKVISPSQTENYVRIAPYANQAYSLDCSTNPPIKGSLIQLWLYDTTNANLRQQWLRSPIAGTTAEKVTLRAPSTQGTMVLDCKSNPAVSGSAVQTWTYTAGDTNQRQQWIFEPVVKIE